MAVPLLLLVEDDDETRSALADFLSAEGYMICEAHDGSDGLDVLRARKPDAVILDYGLPSPSEGREFLEIKSTEPPIASIPVIVASGFVLPPMIDGVVAILTKPFVFDELLALIQQYAGPPDEPNTRTAA